MTSFLVIDKIMQTVLDDVDSAKANLYYTQARKQTTGDPSGVKWNYCGICCYINSRHLAIYGVISHNC